MAKRMGFSVVGLPHYTVWHLYEPSVDDIRHMQEMEQERKNRENEERERADRMKKIKEEFNDPGSQWEKDKVEIEGLTEKDKEAKVASQGEHSQKADTLDTSRSRDKAPSDTEKSAGGQGSSQKELDRIATGRKKVETSNRDEGSDGSTKKPSSRSIQGTRSTKQRSEADIGPQHNEGDAALRKDDSDGQDDAKAASVPQQKKDVREGDNKNLPKKVRNSEANTEKAK